MGAVLERAPSVTFRIDVPETDSIRLSDGRRLSFTQWGDTGGVPIIHHHGMPGSRFDHEADGEFYRSLGVRVITPDRPGYGFSDPNPGGSLLDWAADVAELADALDIRQFGVTSLSGGGIYALACAALMPERVTEAVVTGCPGPMQREGAYAGMRFLTRAGVWLGGHAPGLVQGVSSAVSGSIRRHPGFFVQESNHDKPDSDLKWLSMGSVRAGAEETLREAFRRGGSGYAHDLRLLSQPWGFELEGIRVQVQLWHGDQDTVIPVHHSRYLASVIPGATLRICPGEGHMLLWNHLAEVWAAAAGVRT